MSEPSQRPPIASSPVSVLLFVQAPATETADAIQAWRAYLDGLGRPYEIFLIQETRPEVSVEPAPAVRTFPYERAVGWRDALNDAIRSAQHPLLVFSTCDKQYRPADLDGMLKRKRDDDEEIKKNTPKDQEPREIDLVVGFRTGSQAPLWRVLLDMLGAVFSRVVLGMTPPPRVSWLGSAGWGRRFVARWVFGVRVLDPECPFRLVRRDVFQRLPIQSGGPFVQIEMLAKANFLSCLLAEAPVTWTLPPIQASDTISFSHDARLVFRAPEFGPRLALGANDQAASSASEKTC